MHDELFYKRLTQLRTAKGVSARDMSLSIGQNAGYINGLENHKGLPSMSVFFYICDYLGVTPKEFFDDQLPDPLVIDTLIDDLKFLDREDLELILQIVKRLKK